MSSTLVTDDEPLTRAEIEAAIHGHVLTLKRMPAHWTDRRDSLHERINDLLGQWRAAEA